MDRSDNVYVADYNGDEMVHEFDSSGRYLTNIGRTFYGPVTTAKDSAGNVYIVEWKNNSVQKFNSAGALLAIWDPSHGFAQPMGIAVDRADNVYVVSSGNGQILKFTPDGTPVPSWHCDRSLIHPYGIAIDSAGNIYVTETGTGLVWKFDENGRTDASWNCDQTFNFPAGVAVDSADNVYVVDYGNNQVLKFTSTGRFITKWGSSGSMEGQFNSPSSIAVNSTGAVFVADYRNDRIQIFSPTKSAPSITAGFYAFGHVGQAPYSIRFLDQSTGSPTAWHWDFGDGTTSDEQSPTHVYNRTGDYNVALTVSNDLASDTAIQYRCIIVNTVPVANFTANATAGRTPLTVQFTDQSSGASGYQWQFGDGTTSTEQNPVHTYTAPGTYTVTLTADASDYGSVFVQKPGYITVTDPPTVGFSANVTAGPAPLAVQFNESTNGSVQYYYWQFGDGGTSFDREPVHVYDHADTYTVSLHAIGQNGTEVKTIEEYINVTSPVTPTPTTPAPVNTTTVPTTQVPTTTVTPVPTSTTVVPTVTGNPYNGPHTIPGLLQAEDYDLGGEGVAYHDTTAGNEGGVYRHDDVDIEQLDTDGSPNVGWIRAGEWLRYTVEVSTVGTYDAGFRVASSHTGSTVQVYLDDGTTPIATVNVPNTGDWPVFQTISVPVTLPAGQHRLVLKFPTDYVNLNWISFALKGEP